MKKYKLREGFSVELESGESVNGPLEVELNEESAKANAHKLEEIEAKKKSKKEELEAV